MQFSFIMFVYWVFFVSINFLNKSSSTILVLLTFELFILFFSVFFFLSSLSPTLILLFLFVGVLEAIFGLSVLLFLLRSLSNNMLIF